MSKCYQETLSSWPNIIYLPSRLRHERGLVNSCRALMEYQVSHSPVWLHWHAGPPLTAVVVRKRVATTVIEASMGVPHPCNAGTWLHPPHRFRQEGTNLERNVPTEPRLQP